MAFSLVYITVPTQEEGEKLARALVEGRLAGCANVVPTIKSYYLWEGQVQEDTEALVFVKTRQDLVSQVVEEVKELHSYTVPAILELPVGEGNGDFFTWLAGEIGTTPFQ